MKCRSILIAATITLVSAAPALAVDKAQERAAFIAADKNKDSVLSRPEFTTFIRRMAKLGHKQAREAVLFGRVGIQTGFKRIDTNRDEKLTPEELRRFNEGLS